MITANKKQLKKSVKHDKVSSPYAVHTIAVAELMPFYPIHWHDETEIVRAVSGSGSLIVDGKVINVTRGDIVVIAPFQMHYIDVNASVDLVIDTVLFNMRVLDAKEESSLLTYFAPILTSAGDAITLINQSHHCYSEINSNVDSVITAFKHGSGLMQIKVELYALMQNILRGVKTTDVASGDKRLYTIKKVLQYITANYTTQMTVAEIAEQSQYSEYHMMKLFKHITNSTLVDYINGYRLSIAGERLLNSDDEINCIANSVGYNNVSYFNRQFVALYSMTPRQFRNRYTLI